MHACMCTVNSVFVALTDCLLLAQRALFVLCLKAGGDHHAGPVRRGPQVVDGGHGWERTGGLPWLRLIPVLKKDR